MTAFKDLPLKIYEYIIFYLW